MARYPADLESEFEGEFEDELEGEFEDELEGEFEDEFEDELEGEFEDELEGEFEDEFEGEEFLGGVGRALGGLLGEEEGEFEDEDEAFLGGIARLAGSLLGEGEGEGEDEDEAEEFFGKIGRALRRAAPFLKVLAKTAGPLVATAVGGPAAGALARAVTSQLEGEFEDEFEGELEAMAMSPISPGQSLAEYFAARAAVSESETEAEAFVGAASYMSISPPDRRDLERMLPALLRGSAVLTRLLHSNRHTRQAVRLVPGIVDGAARTLTRHTIDGGQVGPVEIGRALGGATSRALGDPRSRHYLMRRHARGLALARRRHRRLSPGEGQYRRSWYGGGSRRYDMTGRRRYGSAGNGQGGGYAPGALSRNGVSRAWQSRGLPGARIVRAPARSRAVGARGLVPRPRPGFVRIVTPVRVPPRQGRPSQTIRVVSDVRVPRGASAAGRPTAVRPRR